MSNWVALVQTAARTGRVTYIVDVEDSEEVHCYNTIEEANADWPGAFDIHPDNEAE